MISQAAGPDFICIGARKTGTTWLYNFLRAHPDCAMPRIKEINFFNSALARRNSPEEALQKKWAEIRVKLKKPPDHPMPRSWVQNPASWYLKLFEREAGLISGDISPLYQEIRDERVKAVHRLLPRLKVIYILRHPLERILSDFSMYANNRSVEVNTMAEDELFALLQRQYHTSMSYGEVYKRWAAHFPVAMFFYEDLKSEPERFADSLCRYLAITPAPALVKKTKNPNPSRTFGPRPEVPPSVVRKLARMLLPETETLRATIDNVHTQAWVEDIRHQADGSG
jgi:hypothetical protein